MFPMATKMYPMETKGMKTQLGTKVAHFGLVLLSIIVNYIVFFYNIITPTSNMEFQVKVEYVKDKWITF